MPNISERQVGAGFDILDKAVAGRFHELNSREWIARQDYDSWMRDYRQLQQYARDNSGVEYVARQWRDEEPRYAGTFALLQAKIRAANPSNYDDRVSVNGCGSCGGCGGSNIPTLPYSPLSVPGGSFSPLAPRSGGGVNIFSGGGPGFSLGDALRDLFGNRPNLQTEYPNSELIDEGGIVSGIITALVVGGILWIVHTAWKKRNA